MRRTPHGIDWLTICADDADEELRPGGPARVPRRGHRRARSSSPSSRAGRATCRRPRSRSCPSRSPSTSRSARSRRAPPARSTSIRSARSSSASLAGPWAGALTGLLSNLIWSILPVPGGAGPTAALLRSGRGGHRPDGRVLGEPRVPSGCAATTPGRRVPGARRRHRRGRHRRPRRQATIGLTIDFEDVDSAEPLRRPRRGHRRDRRRRSPGSRGARSSTCRAGPADPDLPRRRDRDLRRGLVFAFVRLLFGPNGYFSTVDGVLDDGAADSFLGGADLTGLALADPLG